jgi:predicted  nucleic acid-binding Zn-ribbon protein
VLTPSVEDDGAPRDESPAAAARRIRKEARVAERQRAKDERRKDELEEEVSRLEEEVKEVEAALGTPEVYLSAARSREARSRLLELKTVVEARLSEWEELSRKLEEEVPA